MQDTKMMQKKKILRPVQVLICLMHEEKEDDTMLLSHVI
jgi:hypothetical protein